MTPESAEKDRELVERWRHDREVVFCPETTRVRADEALAAAKWVMVSFGGGYEAVPVPPSDPYRWYSVEELMGR